MALNCIFIPETALAMKPAKFTQSDNVDITFNQFRLISKQNTESDGYSTDGITQLIDGTGKVLWSIPSFVGRQGESLSPDGKILVLSGDKHNTGLFQLNKDAVLATIFDQGKLIKTVQLMDVFSEDPETLASQLKVNVYGGGWVERSLFIKNQTIDWKRRIINFTHYNGKVKEISF